MTSQHLEQSKKVKHSSSWVTSALSKSRLRHDDSPNVSELISCVNNNNTLTLMIVNESWRLPSLRMIVVKSRGLSSLRTIVKSWWQPSFWAVVKKRASSSLILIKLPLLIDSSLICLLSSRRTSMLISEQKIKIRKRIISMILMLLFILFIVLVAYLMRRMNIWSSIYIEVIALTNRRVLSHKASWKFSVA